MLVDKGGTHFHSCVQTRCIQDRPCIFSCTHPLCRSPSHQACCPQATLRVYLHSGLTRFCQRVDIQLHRSRQSHQIFQHLRVAAHSAAMSNASVIGKGGALAWQPGCLGKGVMQVPRPNPVCSMLHRVGWYLGVAPGRSESTEGPRAALCQRS